MFFWCFLTVCVALSWCLLRPSDSRCSHVSADPLRHVEVPEFIRPCVSCSSGVSSDPVYHVVLVFPQTLCVRFSWCFCSDNVCHVAQLFTRALWVMLPACVLTLCLSRCSGVFSGPACHVVLVIPQTLSVTLF